MPQTRLSDVIDVTVFQDMPAENTPEKSAYVESGIVVASPAMDALANREGNKIQMPFWKDIEDIEANISNDDPNDKGTPQKVKQGEQEARKIMLNHGLSTMDLASELTMGDKPMRHIRNRFDAYWVRQWQRRIVATTKGLVAANIETEEGDMVHDVSSDSSEVTEANLFSQSAFIDTVFTLEDSFDSVSAVVMHNVIYKQALKNNDIETIRDSDGKIIMQTYMGNRVIVDDGVPVIAGAEGAPNKYVTVLFGNGAFAYGNGESTVPVEIDREASAGNGGGMETLWMRKTWLIHPLGYAFNSSSVEGASPTLIEYADPTNWSRVVHRKNVPLAFLITNGAEKKKPVTP